MADVAGILPPEDLCNAYIALGEGASKAVIDGLWAQFDDQTAKAMALGIRNLARVWQSAWLAGGGHKASATELKTFTEAAIRMLYEKATFVP